MRPPTIPTCITINRDDNKQTVIMKSLYNSLIEYREPKTHRILVQLFMCLPSRKDFPEYFNIIEKPIAMNKIRERIERQQYPDEQSCMDDFKLMFSNCKFFNEDDSQIHHDAVELEKLLVKKREQLLNEHNRPNRDPKEATKEAVLSPTTNNSTANNTSSPSTRQSNNNHSSNNSTSSTNNKSQAPNSPIKHENNINNSSSNNATTQNNQTHTNSSNNTNDKNHNNSISNFLTSATESSSEDKSNDIFSNKNNDNNGISNNIDSVPHQSDSTNHSTNDQQNDDLEGGDITMNHNHHLETSMDSSSNLSADLLASTPVEKCSLNNRRGRNPDAPKRRLLTGYIIYASEIRKQVIDKNPNQNFGDISRLVGNEWKALPRDIKSKYDQRALIHNKRVRDGAHGEVIYGPDGRPIHANGLHTPKLTKRKLAKMAKESMRQHHLSYSGLDDSTTHSPRTSQDHASPMVSHQLPGSTFKHSQPPSTSQPSKTTTAETSTQTTAIRFVEPPSKKRLVYSESFRKYIESLEVPNKDLLVEETCPERSTELPTHWLGAGAGRHESAEAALWALRDFMLQDAVTMRRSMDPYL